MLEMFREWAKRRVRELYLKPSVLRHPCVPDLCQTLGGGEVNDPYLQQLGEGLPAFRDSSPELEFQGLPRLECLGMAPGQVLRVTVSTPQVPRFACLPWFGSSSSQSCGPIRVIQAPGDKK